MRVWPIFKKEMRLYFTSPIAYVVVAIFTLIAGYFFYSIFAFFTLASMQSMMNPAMARELNVTDSVVRPLFSNISVILLLLIPLVTMRLFAEERRSGTIELLLTYPVRDGAVLAGKYLAALVLYALMLALTLLYPGIVVAFARLEWGPVATGYLGLLLMGGTFIAVGLFASALTENQIVASITTFGILLMLWIIGWSADYAGGAWGKVLQHLSILEHNDNFAKGVLDTKDVVYYLNFIALALFSRSARSKRSGGRDDPEDPGRGRLPRPRGARRGGRPAVRVARSGAVPGVPARCWRAARAGVAPRAGRGLPGFARPPDDALRAERRGHDPAGARRHGPRPGARGPAHLAIRPDREQAFQPLAPDHPGGRQPQDRCERDRVLPDRPARQAGGGGLV